MDGTQQQYNDLPPGAVVLGATPSTFSDLPPGAQVLPPNIKPSAGIPTPPRQPTLPAVDQAVATVPKPGIPATAPMQPIAVPSLPNPKLVQAQGLVEPGEKIAQDVEAVGAAGKELATTQPTAPLPAPALARSGQAAPIPEDAEQRRREEVLAKGMQGGFSLAMPAMLPAAIAAPLPALGAIAAGYAASKGVRAVAKASGASPEMQDLAEQFGWLITPAGLIDAHTGLEVSPEAIRGAFTMFGNRTGAGIAVTPEEIRLRAEIGKFRGEKVIPRKGAEPVAPALEAPTIEGGAAKYSDVPPGAQVIEEKPVHHATNDVEELRASAEKQSKDIGDRVAQATEAIPGAKVENIRTAKDADRIEDKAKRQGVEPSQIADIAGAKVSVPDQESANKVLENLNQQMPVESVNGTVTGEPGKNAVRQTQAIVNTGAPEGEPVKKAEVMIQTPEMAKVTEETHDDYRKAQELRAAGKEAEAGRLESEIARKHEEANQAAEARQGGNNAVQKPSTGSVLQRPSEEVREAGSGRGRVESGQQGQETAAQGTKAARQEIDRGPGKAPIPPQRGDTLKDQAVEVRDPKSGAWKSGTVLADNTTPNWTGGQTIRKVRGVYDDGGKFNNVDIADVRKAAAPVSREGIPGAGSQGKEVNRPQEASGTVSPLGGKQVGVDFDGTLFKENSDGSIGQPIPERIASLKQDLADGKHIIIESHRARTPEAIAQIHSALESVGLPKLPVTPKKNATGELIDDKERHVPGVKVEAVKTDANTPLPGGAHEGKTEKAPSAVQPSTVPEKSGVAETGSVGGAGTEKVTEYKFGSTQANIPDSSPAAKALGIARSVISKDDLAGKGRDVGGDHVTVRYGIKSEDVEGVKKYLASLAPFEASLGKTDKFPPSEHSDGAAVIHAPIKSPELQNINAELEKHGDFTEPSFDEYKPHATVAYVKPEKADRYVGMTMTVGHKFPVNEIAITDREGNQQIVKLEGRKPGQAPIPPKKTKPAESKPVVATPAKTEWHNLDEKIVWRGKTMTRSEAIAKEPNASDDILAARPASSYLPKSKVPTLAEVKELEREYGVTAQRSTNPDVDMAVSRARGRWQDAKKAYDDAKAIRVAKESEAPVAKTPSYQEWVAGGRKGLGPAGITKEKDLLGDWFDKLKAGTPGGRGNTIDKMPKDIVKAMYDMAPEDRPISLLPGELRRMHDRLGLPVQSLEARAIEGGAQPIKPVEDVPKAGKNFEGRYVRAALEPVAEEWEKITSKSADVEFSKPKTENGNQTLHARLVDGSGVVKIQERGHPHDDYGIYEFAPGKPAELLGTSAGLTGAKAQAESILKSGNFPGGKSKMPKEYKADKLVIKVPDDGTFVIPNHPAAIEHALKAAGKFDSSKAGEALPKAGAKKFRMSSPDKFDTEKYIVSIEKEIAELEDKARSETGPSYDFVQEQLKAARENLADAKKQTPESLLTGESGSFEPSKITDFAREEFRKEIHPALEKTGLTFQKALDELTHLIAPRAGVPTKTLDSMMRLAGEREKHRWYLDQVLEKSQKMMDKLSKDDQVEFVDRYKQGQDQPTPELQHLAEFMGKTDEETYRQVVETQVANLSKEARQLWDKMPEEDKTAFLHKIADFKGDESLEESPLKELADALLNYKNDHFRVIWKVVPGTEGKSGAGGVRGRRPLQGSKGFLRQSTLDTMSEGIENGGEPLHWNPVRMFQAAQSDAWRYITAQRMWKEAGDMGERVFVPKGKHIPEGFHPVEDKIGNVRFPAASGEGMIEASRWAMAEPRYRLLENMLSKDWVREHALPNLLMRAKNQLTAWRLSASPFHAITTSVSSAAGQAGRGLEDVGGGILSIDPGRIVKGAVELATYPVAPVKDYLLGTKIIRYATNPEEFIKSQAGQSFIEQYPETQQLISDLFSGGAKLGLHEDERLHALAGFQQAIADQRWIAAGFNSPFALNQQIMRPLFGYYIPRLKLASWLRDYSEGLVKHSEEIDAGKMTRGQLARKTWDHTDNVFGQMNWDKFWWDRTFKAGVQLGFRAFTWFAGNGLLVKDAGVGQAQEILSSLKYMRSHFSGEAPPPGATPIPHLDPNLRRIMGLFAVVAATNAAVQYAMTREKPKDIKDLLAARIGGMDSHGHPRRVLTPAIVVKDAISLYSQGAVRYLSGKISDLFSGLYDVFKNEDFRHQMIHNPDDSFWKKRFKDAEHVIGAPIGISNYERERQQGATKAESALGELGFSPAPAIIDQSRAEKLASEISAENAGDFAMTEQQRAETDQHHSILTALRNGDRKPLESAVKAHSITPREAHELQKRSKLSPLADQVNNFRRGHKAEQAYKMAKRVYDAATPEEKKQLDPIIGQIQRARHLAYWQQGVQ